MCVVRSVPPPLQGNGKPAGSNLRRTTSLLSRSKSALNCRSHIAVSIRNTQTSYKQRGRLRSETNMAPKEDAIHFFRGWPKERHRRGEGCSFIIIWRQSSQISSCDDITPFDKRLSLKIQLPNTFTKQLSNSFMSIAKKALVFKTNALTAVKTCLLLRSKNPYNNT